MTEEKGAYLAVQDFGREQIELIKRTVAKGASDDELALFLHQARRMGLDPLARQIHCVMRYNKSENRRVMSIQVAIDGYRLIADRTGKYAGSDDYLFDNGVDIYTHIKNNPSVPQGFTASPPTTATVTVYKLVAGVRCPFTATAAWRAYYPGDDTAGFMWRKMPHNQLGKCAEALALRKAFPAELSGVYTDDEMMQAGEVVDADAVTIGTTTKAMPRPSAETATTGEIAEPSTKPATESPTVQAIDPEELNRARAYFQRDSKDSNPIPADQVGILARRLSEAIGSKDAEKRHLFLRSVCDVESTHELGERQAEKLLKFLVQGGKVPADVAKKVQEIMAIIEADPRPADAKAGELL